MRRRFIYTVTKFKNGETKRYILTKQQFTDRLAIELGDYDVVGGWCGITSANYEKAERTIRQLKQKSYVGLCCDGINYRIFDEEEFKNYIKKDEYIVYCDNVHNL